MNYIETHLVDHCNLKCRGCSHFSGLAGPYFKNLSEYEDEIRQLAKITNHNIHTIRLMGGEPLLHPDVVEFCIVTRQYFPYSQIALVSNGILLPKLTDEQINTLNHYNIELCMSNYGLKLDQNQINKFNHHYFHNKNDMYNISLDLERTQNNVSSFNNCDIVKGSWYFFKDGRLYQCCVMANIDYFCSYFNKEINYDLDDISIDIYTHTLEEIEAFLHTPHNVCAYCNTRLRNHTYAPFATSKGDIHEWTTS